MLKITWLLRYTAWLRTQDVLQILHSKPSSSSASLYNLYNRKSDQMITEVPSRADTLFYQPAL